MHISLLLLYLGSSRLKITAEPKEGTAWNKWHGGRWHTSLAGDANRSSRAGRLIRGLGPIL